MKMTRSFVNGLIYLVLMLVVDHSAAATKAISSSNNLASSNSESTQIQLRAKIDALSANKTIDEVSKAQLFALYQSALDNLASIELFTAKTIQFEDAIKKAPDKTKKLQQEFQQNQYKNGKQKPEDFTEIPLEELEQRLILEKGKADAIDEQISLVEREFILQNERPQKIRQETLVAQEALETAQKKLQTLPENTASKPEVEAGQIQLRALIDSRKTELKMLFAEANSNPIRAELLKAELQNLKLQKDQMIPVLSIVENLVNERRQQEAINLQNELTQVEKTASGKHELIQQAARDNIQYSREFQAISGKIETYTELNKKVDAAASEIEADYKSAEKKISLAGLSPVLGKILREQRRNLLSQDQFVLETEAIQEEMALTSLEQFKVEDRLKLLSDLDGYLKDLMDRQINKALPVDQRMMIQAELRVLLNNQKELLNKLSSAYDNYLRTLGDFDFAKQQMLAQANKFAEYLDERLLWVPSSVPVNGSYLPGLYETIKWFLSPHNGLGLIKDTSIIAWQSKLLTFLALSTMLALPKLRGYAKIQLKAVTEKSEKIYTDSFSNTLKAFAYTLILVLPLPLVLSFFGWLLSSNVHVSNFSKAIGIGLQSIAIPLFALQLFYRLFAENGIAIKHFQWQKTNAHLLKRQVAWIRFIIVPCVFMINCTGASVISNHSDNLGRLALIIAMSALSVFFAQLLHPTTGLFQTYMKANPDDGFTKLRFVWYPMIVAIPIAVIGFAVAGYYLSALELQQKLVITIRLIFAIVIVYGMVIRWLTLVNRELAIKNARQKRKAAAQSEKQASSGDMGGDMPVLPVDEQLIDIPTINAQTIKLLIVFIGFTLIVGLWMIWRNILPAFSFLDNIVLWQHLVTVDNQESYQPITLTNLMMAGLYIFIIVVSVRNFPGLMELLFFSRLSIAAGGRYAVNQLARYIIIAIGFICLANELGGSWSQVQWLVAALSVGLGFGLQEIFANLVSGIILLFERPIRVGDTVTINSVTGKVSRIQMRATTIIDYDHKELIVPNKTFITNQLVNWTLSDTITRIQIPLIIAFGSDVALAHNLMLEVARSTPLVLKDPLPSVVFNSIKEGGLEFTMTVFVCELGHRMQVTHEINIKLEKMLRENNIELPMLQREIQILNLEKGN
jgi:potassium-dependent mechanosensitive channel